MEGAPGETALNLATPNTWPGLAASRVVPPSCKYTVCKEERVAQL